MTTDTSELAISDQSVVRDLDEPLLVTVTEACRLLSCGKTTAFSLIASGRLERKRLGRATRVTMASVRELAGA